MSQPLPRSAASGLPGKPSGPPGRRRTPLSVVPAGPASSRVPFAVFSCAALVAALVAVLMLNISVSGSQYELVSLRGEQVVLSHQNQSLTQRLEDAEAPQNLAVRAAELGMVASPTFGMVDVDSGKVAGNPEPAKEGGKPLALIQAPEVVTVQEVPEPAPYIPEPAPVPDQAPEPRSAPAEAQQEPPVESASPKPETPKPETPKPAAPTPAAPTPAELNGGTIPGPQQATAGP